MNLINDLKNPNPPEEILCVIEIPKNSSNKYEICHRTGVLFLDRVLYSSIVYPCDYGFIPQTLAGDGDPLDCLVITSNKNIPKTAIKVRPIGMLITKDENGEDEKILAVPVNKIDPRFKHIKDIKDVPEHLLAEIKYFYEHYKDLEPNKWVKVEKWENVTEAKKQINLALEKFREKY
ncbi:MAG: inorganic pyrophosphatase [Candidatus Aenigmarchaeota archaeon ex4484_52]|nr:MAG: inorganic pyrophosphatase [Candidatus Aenigmarchaeota archaeon ex4484_52]